MIKFFYSTQTCSTATHIALEEAGLPYEGVEVSWQRNVNVAELEKVNPMGAVPAVLIDGKALTQTAAILEYIGDQKGLLPKPGTPERLEAMEWIAFATADLQKIIGNFFSFRRATVDEKSQAELKKLWGARLDKYLAFADKHLTGRDYTCGKSFTVADASLFTILGWTKWIEHDVSSYPNVVAYMRRMSARPAVKKVLEKEGLVDTYQR